MGGTAYSVSDRFTRSASLGYQTKSRDEIFEQNAKREIHKDMNPSGVTMREARDSETHPNSVPIIFAMDVTGSMGHIPHGLIKEGLPKLVSAIIEAGIPDPQIMFLAIGDHISDNAPLQISQFESGDAELDMWLTRVWLEGNGGGNGGESYSLAHYFAANHTVTDNWEKRKQKGFLFTIGDERNHPDVPASALRSIMGNSEIQGYKSADILKKAQEKWNVYHIHPGMEKDGSRNQWKDLLGEQAFYASSPDEIPHLVAQTVVDTVKRNATFTSTPVSEASSQSSKPVAETASAPEEVIL